MSQLSHYTSKFTEKKFPVILVLDGVSSPANVGSLFRLADAFNIEKIILCGPRIDMGSNRLLRTARSTVEKVAFEEEPAALEVCRKYVREGYTLLALEITEDSVPIDQFGPDNQAKIVLLVGNERMGIEEEALKLAHRKLHINMYGKNSSMNVAQATGIALYEITKSLQKFEEK